MNGQQEDAMAIATAPAPAATREREQRHCPECGNLYECRPNWMRKRCPACNGQHIREGHAKRRAGTPPAFSRVQRVPPEYLSAAVGRIDEPSPVDHELSTLRVVARAFEDLDRAARARVMAWLTARYAEPTP